MGKTSVKIIKGDSHSWAPFIDLNLYLLQTEFFQKDIHFFFGVFYLGLYVKKLSVIGSQVNLNFFLSQANVTRDIQVVVVLCNLFISILSYFFVLNVYLVLIYYVIICFYAILNV